MRIALGIWGLTDFGGTETYLLTVSGELERLGHDVWIYAPEIGPCADFAVEHGMRVVQHESRLPECDAVLAQDAVAAYILARRFPDAVRIMVAHSAAFPLQSPPQVPDVCHAVVVMNDRLGRRTRALAWHPLVARLRQPVDLQRFCFRALNLEQRRPPRVLLLSNHSQGTRHRMIEEACRIVGFEFDHAGSTGIPTTTSEHRIAAAEIVVSLGRGALEAMASGRAVYVYGPAGGDGWVTAATYPAMESEGLSGRAFGHATNLEQLAGELSQWSEDMGEVGRDLAAVHHDVQVHAVELIDLIEKLGADPSPAPTVAGELARQVRIEWDRNGQLRGAAAEAAIHRTEATRLRAQLADVQTHVVELEVQVGGLQAEAQDLRRQHDAHEAHEAREQARAQALQDQVEALQEQADALHAALASARDDSERTERSIAAVHATRTMRWTRRARSAYGRVRTMVLARRPTRA